MIGKIVSRCGKIQLVGIYNWKHIYNNTANQVDVYYFWDLFMYYKDVYDLVGGIPTS